MLVFHGGLSIEQVNLLEQNQYKIFKKIPKCKIFIPNKNTFDYIDYNRIFESRDKYWETIIDDIYENQYIFFFKYLKNSLGFCHNTSKRNYILVADIDEKILNNFIGCGRYTGAQIEYRVPRKFITPDTIKEFLFYEPYDDEQTKEIREKYPDNYYSEVEDIEANMIMRIKKLEFNEYKKFPNFD